MQTRGQEVVEGLERLNNNFCIRQNRHKVGIAVPAGNQVPVKMSGQAGTGGGAEVDANVEAVGAHDFLQELDHAVQGLHGFQSFGGIQFAQLSFMGTWPNKQVTVVIGNPIQNHDRAGCSQENEIAAIVLFRQALANETVVVGSGSPGGGHE